MNGKTLREILHEAVADLGEPSFALFTTFNFDPTFFEDYVLPVFAEGLDASSISGIFSAEQFLRKMPTVVFYDADQLAHGRKRLSYGTVPVRPAKHHFFHPKLILLAGEQGDFRLIVSSANLTVAGWGRNAEVASGVIDVPSKSYLSLTLFRTLEQLRGYATDHLRGIEGDTGWYVGLESAIEGLSTYRRRSEDRRFLFSSLAEEHDRSFLFNLKAYADAIDARRLTIYSPYFASDLSALVAAAKEKIERPELEVRIVPALERSPQGRPRIGVCRDELDRDRDYALLRVEGDGAERFRHAKLLWLEGTRRRHVVIVGSHNFTRSALNVGLGGQKPNIEASLALELGQKDAMSLLGTLAELSELDLDSVELKSRDDIEREAPRLSAFACTVVADWRDRLYHISTAAPAGGSVSVELPGVSANPAVAAGEAAVVPFSEQTDAALRKRKHFRAWLQGSADEPLVGLICEVGWERFRSDAVGDSLADFIDVWRAADHEQMVDRSSRKKLRLPDGDDRDVDGEPDGVAAIAERLEKQEHLDTLYGLLGGFVELRRHLDEADSSAAIEDLLFCSPHSLDSFLRLLETQPEGTLSSMRRWVVYTEALHLLGHPAAQEADPGIRERLERRGQELRRRCEEIERNTELRAVDRAHIPDNGKLFQWFREQLGTGFVALWEETGR